MKSNICIGTSRLPRGELREQSIDIIRYAIDNGLDFIDGARGYWDVELILAKALKNGYRNKVQLSSKWTPWMMKVEQDDNASKACTIKRIQESLIRLETDYLDYFFVWSQREQKHLDSVLEKDGMLEGLLEAKKRGYIRHIGCSIHDSPENVEKNADKYNWAELLMFSYNILNRMYENIFPLFKKIGKKIMVMNPLGGGSFLSNNKYMSKIVQETSSKSIADLSLRFLMSQANIDYILSGISSKEDVDYLVKQKESPILNSEQIFVVNSTLKKLQSMDGFCTSCFYCMPCPNRVNIPSVMQSIFIEKFSHNKEAAKKSYQTIEGKNADFCISCGLCEMKCTQKLSIIDGMNYAKNNFKE
jgi:uncharacterized protein